MPTYTWINEDTGETLEVMCRIADRDIPPTSPGSWKRIMEAPALMQAAYLDGQRAQSDQTYDKLKKAAQLKIDYANEFSGSKERDRIGKEIRKLEEVK